MNSINPTNISGLSSMRASAPNVAANKSVSAQEQTSAPAADSFAQTSVDSEAALNVNLAKLREQVGSSKVEGSVSAKCGECDPPTASQEADHLEESAEKREAASARGEQAAQQLRAKAEALEYRVARYNYAKQVVANCQQRAKELDGMGDSRVARGAAMLWNPYAYVMGLSYDNLGTFEMDMAEAYLKEAAIWAKEIDSYDSTPDKDLAEAKKLRQMADHNQKLAAEQRALAQQERTEAARIRWNEGEYNNMAAEALEASAASIEAKSDSLLSTASQGNIAR